MKKYHCWKDEKHCKYSDSVADSVDAGGGKRNGGAGAEGYDHGDSVLSEFPSAGAGDAR